MLLAIVLGGCANQPPASRVADRTPAPTAPASAGSPPSPSASDADSPSASPVARPAPAPPIAHPPPPPPSAPAPPGGYTFPLSPAASARYGRAHHDYPATDIFAPCGTPVVAVTAGVVDEVSRTDSWSAVTDDPALRGGLSTSIVGDDGVRYYGSHLSEVAPGIEAGVRVHPGQPLGKVGDSGNARGTGCHLHFGISPPCGPGDWRVRRGTIYPWPFLDSWRAGEARSPYSEVKAWNDSNRACAV